MRYLTIAFSHTVNTYAKYYQAYKYKHFALPKSLLFYVVKYLTIPSLSPIVKGVSI
jgi:hypothetical protein